MKEFRELREGAGLWANIRAKKARGEKMRAKGEKGAPTPDAIKQARGESVSEEKDPNEYDNEGGMMKGQLRQICSANEKLMKMVDDDDNLPEWVQSKVTKATDYIRSVRDYLESEDVKESVEVEENAMAKMKLINKMKKASPAAKKALEAPSRVDKKKESVEEAKSGSGYELYHKDFSSAMQHAYKHAKDKLKIEIDPKEIDSKVASGPRKPSSGKTNSYRLTDKSGKKGVQIQVANLDNKRYELNMYKESLDEISVKDVANQIMMKKRADAGRKSRFKGTDKLKTDLARLKTGLNKGMKPLKAYTEAEDKDA